MRKNIEVCITKKGAILTQIRNNSTEDINWIFLPGGPGCGSEYFNDLTQSLNVPGKVWHLDLPGSGVNRDFGQPYEIWQDILVDAVKTLENPVLVAHSFAGMLTLATPALKEHLNGLVLFCTSPKLYFDACDHCAKEHYLPDIDPIIRKYFSRPSDQALKELFIEFGSYLFPKLATSEVKDFFKNVSMQYEAFNWGNAKFYPTFETAWVPDTFPALVLSAENDYVMPPILFKEDKRFQIKNIEMKIIPDAGHYPWMEQNESVSEAFEDFSKKVISNIKLSHA